MALKYVYSGAAGAGTGADWTNAYLTLAAAFAGMAAGDTAYVAHDHAETQATAMTLTSPGTAAAPCSVLCVNRSGTVPPVSADLRTTATITTTGASTMIFAGNAYCYGIIFSAGTGAVNSQVSIAAGNARAWKFNSCAIRKLGTTASTSAILIGSATAGNMEYCAFENTTIQFGAAGDQISLRGTSFSWKNTANAITGATLPTTLFAAWSGAWYLIEGVDLSALGSGKTLVNLDFGPGNFVFKDCKLGSSVTIASNPVQIGDSNVYVILSDSSGTNYRCEKHAPLGVQTIETTIVRTGGATDGTTPVAWKIVTNARTKWAFPFECLPITFWNEVVGSAITVEVEGIWGGGAVPNNDEIWLEAEYLGASGNPQGSFVSGSKADILATGSALSAGSGTWGGSTTKFKLSVTFTPQQKGPVTLYVKAAKLSSTFYIDPKPVVSGVSIAKSFILSPGVYANELSGGGGISRARAASGF